MENQNLPCPRCPKVSHSISELTTHLRSVHRFSESEINSLRGRGYFEEGQPTPEGTVAVEHQKAALRAQMERTPPLNVPMVPPPERKRIASAPAGWAKTLEGFQYEKLISQKNTIDSIIKKVLKGSVIANHATLELYIFTKNVGELSELQDKERILEAKLSGYVTSDPEYHTVAEKLYETKEKIKTIKQDIGADTEKEVYLEDWFSGDCNLNDEYIEWQEKFMQKALLEAEQVMKEHNPKAEIKL